MLGYFSVFLVRELPSDKSEGSVQRGVGEQLYIGPKSNIQPRSDTVKGDEQKHGTPNMFAKEGYVRNRRNMFIATTRELFRPSIILLLLIALPTQAAEPQQTRSRNPAMKSWPSRRRTLWVT